MGSPSGEIGFPEHVQDFHDEFLSGAGAPAVDTHIDDAVQTLITTNPYDSLAPYDPAAALGTSGTAGAEKLTSTLDAELVELDTMVTALSHKTDWAGMVTKALGKLEGAIEDSEEVRELRRSREVNYEAAQNAADLLDSAAVEQLMTSTRNRMGTGLAQSYSRFTAGMFDINAVVSTVFPAGMAMLEADHTATIGNIEATLQQRALEQAIVQSGFEDIEIERMTKNLAREKLVFLLQSVETMANMQRLAVSSKTAWVQQYDAAIRLTMGAHSDEARLQIEYDLREAYNDLDVLLKGLGGLGAVNGIPTVPKELTPFQSVVSALGASASLGLTAASALGPAAGVAAFGVSSIFGVLGALDG